MTGCFHILTYLLKRIQILSPDRYVDVEKLNRNEFEVKRCDVSRNH